MHNRSVRVEHDDSVGKGCVDRLLGLEVYRLLRVDENAGAPKSASELKKSRSQCNHEQADPCRCRGPVSEGEPTEHDADHSEERNVCTEHASEIPGNAIHQHAVTSENQAPDNDEDPATSTDAASHQRISADFQDRRKEQD